MALLTNGPRAADAAVQAGLGNRQWGACTAEIFRRVDPHGPPCDPPSPTPLLPTTLFLKVLAWSPSDLRLLASQGEAARARAWPGPPGLPAAVAHASASCAVVPASFPSAALYVHSFEPLLVQEARCRPPPPPLSVPSPNPPRAPPMRDAPHHR